MIRWSIAILMALAFTASGLEAQTLADYDYEDLSFSGVSLDYGYLWPTRVEPTSRYGVRFDLGYLGPGVRIVPTITYWNSRMRRGELSRLADRLNELPALSDRWISIDGSELGQIRWSDLAFNLDGQYAWITDFGFMTYLGAGVGIHKFSGSGAVVDGTFIEGLLNTVSAGVSGMAGFEVEPVRQISLYAEASYTLMSYLRYPALKFGASWNISRRRETGR